jgi:hypothetical protein
MEKIGVSWKWKIPIQNAASSTTVGAE